MLINLPLFNSCVVLRLTDFVKSIIKQIVLVIIGVVVPLAISPYLQYSISLSMVIIIVVIVAFVVSVFYSWEITRIRDRLIRIGATKYSCHICGEPFYAFQPDGAHTLVRLVSSPDAIKRTFKCVKGHENTIYWERLKPLAVK